MQCVKIKGTLNNYEVEINRIIKDARKENLYLSEAYLEEEAIVLKFVPNPDRNNKKRVIVVQGRITKYNNQKYEFILGETNRRRSFKDKRYVTWAVVSCIEFKGKYLLFLSRKKRGFKKI